MSLPFSPRAPKRVQPLIFPLFEGFPHAQQILLATTCAVETAVHVAITGTCFLSMLGIHTSVAARCDHSLLSFLIGRVFRAVLIARAFRVGRADPKNPTPSTASPQSVDFRGCHCLRIVSVLYRHSIIWGFQMYDDVDRCRQLLLDLCRVNHTLDQAGLENAAAGWKALEQQMVHEASVLLRSARHQPVLWSYQSDATSFKCRLQINDRSSSSVQQRRGRHLEEFLSERGMLKTISLDGRMTMAMLLGMPRPLRAGKAADNHFVAACEFAGRLSLDKHDSIMITHLCFDRAIFSAVHNRFVQLQAMRFDASGEMSLDFVVRENSSWLTAVGCCAHDMQHAIKWGLYRAVEPGLIDDIHISTEALLNSIGPLYAHLKPWLVRVVSFTGTQSEDLASRWWRFLGAEPQWLDLLSEVRPPFFRSGSLHVNPGICNHIDHMEKIMRCWVYCLRWRHFTESRWCSIGMACRQLLRSLSMGVESLVSETRADKSVSDYFLHGAARMSPVVKRYAATAAAAARPAEAFLLEVLGDDRLGRRAEQAQAALIDELSYL
jgi:hypothetical protein